MRIWRLCPCFIKNELRSKKLLEKWKIIKKLEVKRRKELPNYAKVLNSQKIGSVKNEEYDKVTKAWKRLQTVESEFVFNVFDDFVVHVTLYMFFVYLM